MELGRVVTENFWAHQQRRVQQMVEYGHRGARLAVDLRTYDTVGVRGSFLSPVLRFDIQFIDMPSVSYGCWPLDPLALPDLPMLTGGAYDWERNSSGLYTGVRVWVRVVPGVDFEPGIEESARAAPPVLRLRHNFTFTGNARSNDAAIYESWQEARRREEL